MEELIQVSIDAKKTAELYFKENNVERARFSAVKAQMLNPKLDGISELVAALDVIVSAERPIKEAETGNQNNGNELYRYKVLDVNPDCDYLTMRRQYKKLAYEIHPDRNKSVASLSAFKILSEAWSFLSNREKRKQEEISENTLLKIATFWTQCSECSTQYEYGVELLNKYVRCLRCRGHFLTVEIENPPLLSDQNVGENSTVRPTGFTAPVPLVETVPAGRNEFSELLVEETSRLRIGKPDFGEGTLSGSRNDFRLPNALEARRILEMKAKNVIHQRIGENKRAEVKPSLKRPTQYELAKEKTGRKKQALTVSEVNPTLTGPKPVMESVLNTAKPSLKRPRQYELTEEKTGCKRSALTISEVNPIPTGPDPIMSSIYGPDFLDFDQKIICQRIAENRMADPTAKPSLMRPRHYELSGCKKSALTISEVNPTPTGLIPTMTSIPGQNFHDFDQKIICQRIAENRMVDPTAKLSLKRLRQYELPKGKFGHKKSALTMSKVNPIPTMPEPVMISVPDPDFYDFDKDRTGCAFDIKQVWAAYDHEDGMPRLYAQIHDVISRDPFDMRISWLFPNTNRDVSLVNPSIPISSGEFLVGKPVENRDLMSFSHKVLWMRESKGKILIYPAKGEVWALYKNWSPSWNAFTRKNVIREYFLVEVLGNFFSKFGVKVLLLAKVPGFKSVFRRVREANQIINIPEEEMSRFSHRVPAHWLKGDEGQNAPKDCWDIDPAASSSELLRVIPIHDLTEDCTDNDEVAMEKASEAMIKGDEGKVYHRIP